MAPKRLRVGIAGYGRSGCGIHARWLREDPEKYEIVAVCDTKKAFRDEAKEDFGCKVYTDWKPLLEETKMDLFINALPSHLHVKPTIEALRRGNHVVCEKPLATKVKDFDRMVEAAKKAKKAFIPFQNSRFFPFFRKMREVLDSGVLGELVHVRSTWGAYARRWDWQTLQEFNGGNLLNTGPHPMDHAIMLFGKKSPKVFCRMKAEHPSGGDAENFCHLTLYGGAKDPVIDVQLNSFLAYPPADMYSLSCTRGGLAGGPDGLRWKYFDPKKTSAPKMWKNWSDKRAFCGEKLPWVEKTWTPAKHEKDSFNHNSRAFYDNVHDVIVKRGRQIIRHDEVRRQLAAIEECHRQNRLPKRKTKA